MEATEALYSRVSPVKLKEPGPKSEELEKILTAAAAAPDHGRLKPWRFLLIEGLARERFGDLMADSLKRREPDATSEKLDAERKKALRAPTLIVAAAAVQEPSKIPAIEQIVAVGAATENLLLAAHAMGYGGFWRTGAAAYDPQMKQALGLTTTDAVVGFIYLGTVDVQGRPRQLTAPTFSRWEGPN